jgi:hypothetical protein
MQPPFQLLCLRSSVSEWMCRDLELELVDSLITPQCQWIHYPVKCCHTIIHGLQLPSIIRALESSFLTLHF